MEKNVLTDMGGLDLLVGGGFPFGSLILLAGNPGTGKTVFSAQFIYRGAADYGENGVYVSFAESREVFLRNTWFPLMKLTFLTLIAVMFTIF